MTPEPTEKLDIPDLVKVDPAVFEEKRLEGLQRKKVEMEKIGVGVTKNAQKLFDFISKTYLCI